MDPSAGTADPDRPFWHRPIGRCLSRDVLFSVDFTRNGKLVSKGVITHCRLRAWKSIRCPSVRRARFSFPASIPVLPCSVPHARHFFLLSASSWET